MNLKECIKKSGKTSSAIAEELGVSDGSISLWASGGRIPSKDNMKKLLGYFDGLESAAFYK